MMLNGHGQMCCLGFHARALGCSPQKLLGRFMPSDVAEIYASRAFRKRLPVSEEPGYQITDHDWANKAQEANDTIYEDATRESFVANIFRENGWEVEFIGEYPERGEQ